MTKLLSVLHGYCTIKLVRNISRDNFHPIFKVAGNVLVDEKNFQVLNQHTWLRKDVFRTKSYYACRFDGKGISRVIIYMSREILGLPRGGGHKSGVGDHYNHDIRDDTEENLRFATTAQNQMNGVKRGLSQRFKGVNKNTRGNKYSAYIKVNGLTIFFSSVLKDVEAALMYNEAAKLIFKEFAYLNEIPIDEMPTEERQQKLRVIVFKRLGQEY